MFRALLELIVTIIVAMAARAIFASLMKGVGNASRGQYSDSDQQPPRETQRPPKERVTVAGELHKDPVCGTYVAESTKFKRGAGRETFYYCSDACKGKHTVGARS